MESAVDYLVGINDIWKYIKQKISFVFTIKVDPLGISKDAIKFRGINNFGGYTVTESIDEHNRRIVHWFYRNIEAPTLVDWDQCTYLFGLKDIPTHVLRLYNHEGEPLDKYILIHNITRDYIKYTYENKEDEESITVTVPLGTASLVPERFLFNLKLFNKRNQ